MGINMIPRVSSKSIPTPSPYPVLHIVTDISNITFFCYHRLTHAHVNIRIRAYTHARTHIYPRTNRTQTALLGMPKNKSPFVRTALMNPLKNPQKRPRNPIRNDDSIKKVPSTPYGLKCLRTPANHL